MGDFLSVLSLDPSTGPWTADDYFALPVSPTKVELQDGSYVVSPSPGPRHQVVEARLVVAMALAGRLAMPELDVRLSGTRVRRPDLVVTRLDAQLKDTYPGPTDVELVIEIISSSSRSTDRLVKPLEYAEARIPGFWLVELEPEVSLTAFTLVGDRYRELGTWRSGQTARIAEPFAVDVTVSDLLA